jgi:hypothetical protein
MFGAPPRFDRCAGGAFVILTALFGLAVLIRIFFAGEATMIQPEARQQLVAWIHLFQWGSVPLPVAAYAAGRLVAARYQ